MLLCIYYFILVILVLEELQPIVLLRLHHLQLSLRQHSSELTQLVSQLFGGGALQGGCWGEGRDRLADLLVLGEKGSTDLRYMPLEDGILGFYFESFFI